ncbi:MAG: response regulator transcription factor [Acidimicrobiia bacterium]|nr:response regulator transcription factor [Acidimicrobiia bacterium]
MIRVLVVDDHAIVRAGVIHHLSSHDMVEVVGEAGSASEAIDVARTAGATVAVVDLRLPDGHGTDVCRTLLSSALVEACVIHTSFADPKSLRDALDAGALGYVLKSTDTARLGQAITSAASGVRHIDPEAQAALDRYESGDTGDGQLELLSPQERRVLDLIATGLTNREIADEMSLAEKTVKNYVSNMLHKLGMKRRSEAAALAARLQQ